MKNYIKCVQYFSAQDIEIFSLMFHMLHVENQQEVRQENGSRNHVKYQAKGQA